MPCSLGHNHIHVRQVTNQTCGTACIEMVLRRADAQLEYAGFQENFYNSFARDGNGLNDTHLMSIMRGLGFGGAVAHDRNGDQAVPLLRNCALPAIAEVAVQLSAKVGLHWVVVDGRSGDRDKLCILDPSQDGVICAALPKSDHVSYQIRDGRTLLFTGRMIYAIGRL